MAFVAGKNTVFKLDNSSGTLTALSAYITDVSVDLSDDNVETTTFGDSAKEYTLTLADSSLSVTALFDATLLTHLGAIKGQAATVTYEWSPNGTSSSEPKVTGECRLTGMSPTGSVGGMVGLNFTLQGDGATTISTH
jgi:hypothetical protein